jgi:hypothetical protein
MLSAVRNIAIVPEENHLPAAASTLFKSLAFVMVGSETLLLGRLSFRTLLVPVLAACEHVPQEAVLPDGPSNGVRGFPKPCPQVVTMPTFYSRG